MKLALISDIHGNLEALEAVFLDVEQICPDAKLVCAGDIVGYGPDPEGCIDRLRLADVECVAGNHEEMVLGRRNFSRCVFAGITAAVWTRKTLSARSRDFLNALPHYLEPSPGVVVCHGDLRDADTYVSDEASANVALAQLRELVPHASTLICGHTHSAAIYSSEAGFSLVRGPSKFRLNDGARYLLNPGAVGQSRDGKPVARYAVLDPVSNTIVFRELSYDHEKTVAKLRRLGLVPSVVLLKPRGARRYVEAVKTRWARHWAEKQAAPNNQS